MQRPLWDTHSRYGPRDSHFLHLFVFVTFSFNAHTYSLFVVRHPVHLCCFDETRLITANVPLVDSRVYHDTDDGIFHRRWKFMNQFLR